MKHSTTRMFLVGAIGSLFITHSASAITIFVDVDPTIPGIQAAYAVPLGAPAFPVDVYIGGDGVSVMSGFANELAFNDAGAVLALAGPTLIDPTGVGILGGMAAPLDIAGPVIGAPGAALTPLGYPVAGVGAGGPFTVTDGGAGAFDGAGTMFGGAPIPLGPILLTSTLFAPAGVGISDVAAIGLFGLGPFPPGTPEAAALVAPGALPGLWPAIAEVYDAPLGVATAAAGPPAPFGIFPGVITVFAVPIPEPTTVIPLALMLGAIVMRRHRR